MKNAMVATRYWVLLGCMTNGNEPEGATRAATPFNPLTTQPVRGTHYQPHPNFRNTTAPSAYQLPLTFQASVAARF